MSKPKKKKKKKITWKTGIPVNKLNFKEAQNFKKAHELLTGPIAGPEGWQYFLRCFRFLMAFSIACVVDNKYPPLTKCWNELNKLYMHKDDFDDEVFVPSWIFINFQCGQNGETALQLFEESLKNEETSHDFQYFFKQMKDTRLGIYQEIMSSKKIMKFRELITGNVVTTIRSIKEFEKGELFLTRLVEYKGELLHFGDPKCWPKEYKPVVEGFVHRKMNFFEGSTDEEKYSNLMKYAGPYWMSCVSLNHDLPILEPDHYMQYYND